MKTVQYLDAVKRKLGITSDYALQAPLELSKQAIAQLRHQRAVMSTTTAAKIAWILDLDPLHVIADAELERGSNEKLWRRLRDAAAAVLVAIGLVCPAPDAQARFDISVTAVRTVYTLRAARRWWRRLALTAALALGACTSIDTHTKPPADWPVLRIVEHRLPSREFRNKCAPYVAWHSSALACMEWRFAAQECHTFYNADFPPPPFVIEHENLHCAGHDHPGERTARDAWHAFSTSVTSRALADSIRSRQ